MCNIHNEYIFREGKLLTPVREVIHRREIKLLPNNIVNVANMTNMAQVLWCKLDFYFWKAHRFTTVISLSYFWHSMKLQKTGNVQQNFRRLIMFMISYDFNYAVDSILLIAIMTQHLHIYFLAFHHCQSYTYLVAFSYGYLIVWPCSFEQ